MAKPTIVFVPGAWHPPTAYDLLTPRLHAAGYATTYVYLASVGAAAPVTYEDDVAAVRRVVAGLVELGREVVVVSHSYGASPATDALTDLARKDREGKGLTGGVIQLLYIAAIVPTKGVSPAEAFGPVKPKEEGGNWMLFKYLGGGFASVENPEECFYHDVPPEIAKYHASLLQPHFQPTGGVPLTYEAYRDIPAAYIFCTEDRAFPIAGQREIVRLAGIQRTTSLNASHSPFISDPEGVVDFIRELLEGRRGWGRVFPLNLL
ncbi:Alpha/beta hydrolase fold-1 [Aspergillus pseudoustus]|uniref:Alpha/beta hydrolase fold-1 n=1 Tax=Aspergillus pseudoustus TaxID=1810923 RepID=A0ABR4IZV6_9EURO